MTLLKKLIDYIEYDIENTTSGWNSNYHLGVIYFQLLYILHDIHGDSFDVLEETYNDYLKYSKEDSDWWFTLFHKLFRQVDMYIDYLDGRIGGRLDSIFWHMIHVDKDGYLHKCLIKVFEKHKIDEDSKISQRS